MRRHAASVLELYQHLVTATARQRKDGPELTFDRVIDFKEIVDIVEADAD